MSTSLDGRSDVEYAKFISDILNLTGLDLRNYKEKQMRRRINGLMDLLGVDSYAAYVRVLREDPEKYDQFVKRLTINVSEFFRNPERWIDLEKRFVPELLKGKSSLKVWSAGCSNGPEPYSLAILLQDLAPNRNHKVLATDVDKVVLEAAIKGEYGIQQLRHVSPERMKKYLAPLGGDRYEVKPEIKKMIQFKRQNLLTDTFEKDIDLILCRNVVIYFTEEAKTILYQKFFQALRPGGILMVGGTEPLLRYREYGFDSVETTFYRRPEVG